MRTRDVWAERALERRFTGCTPARNQLLVAASGGRVGELAGQWTDLQAVAGTGDLAALRAALDTLHTRAMNDPLWHARCHWAYARLALAEGRPGLTLAELRLMGFAPLASVARRFAGLQPGEEGGGSLLGTVRMRWR